MLIGSLISLVCDGSVSVVSSFAALTLNINITVNPLAIMLLIWVLEFIVVFSAYRYRRRIISFITSLVTKRLDKYRDLRSSFMRFDFRKTGKNRMPLNHTHPEAAHERDTLSVLMTKFCNLVGLRRYDVSMSNREVRANVSGKRYYYNIADLGVPYRSDKPTDNDLITYCDVDYYITKDELYSEVYGKPFMMNTFVPNALSGTVKNGIYYYTDTQTIYTAMLGGATYYHKTLKHDVSHVVMHGWFSFCVYNVDRVQVSDTRYVVLYTPQSIVYDPFRFLRRLYSTSDFEMVYDGATRNGNVMHKRYLEGKSYNRSIMLVGNTVSVELPELTFAAIKAQFSAAKHNNTSDVEKYLKLNNFEAVRAAHYAPLLFECLTDIKMMSTLSIGVGAPSYQVVVEGGLITENQGHSTNESVSPPIVANGGPAPVESHNNDLACVQHRIIQPHNTNILNEQYQQYAKEFVELLVPNHLVGKGCPLSNSEVVEIQDRPLQRQRSTMQKIWHGGKMTVKAFQKKETYGKVSAPRNISTVTPSHTVGLSQFTYPFKYAVLKFCNWYFPCLTPRETVTELRCYIRNKKKVDCTDYTSFDGTNSRDLRNLVERQAYLRYYPKEYHSTINKFFDDEFDATAITSHGVVYHPDGSRLSGSPLTTDGNTMLNAFASYCGYRLAGKTLRQAFDAIGPKYGDDSVEDVDCKLDEVCEHIGFKIKHEVINRGSPMPFLGRILINPWVSDTSVQDPLRTLVKIHQSFPDGKTTPSQAAINRCHGYLVTESHTPIIGDYCRKVIDILGGTYKRGIDKEMDMRVENGAWPHEPGLASDVDAVVAKSCGINACDVGVICEKIKSWRKFEDFEPLINNELKIVLTSQVDGKLLYGDQSNCHAGVVSDTVVDDVKCLTHRVMHRKAKPGPSRRQKVVMGWKAKC